MAASSPALIAIGSYEQVLCGLRLAPNARSKGSGATQAAPPMPSAEQLRVEFMSHRHVGAIKCVAISGDWLVSGGDDEILCVYDLNSRTTWGVLDEHQDTITSVSFASSTRLLSTDRSGTIILWRTRSWDVVARFQHDDQGSPAAGAAAHPSGKIAISVGRKTLCVWDLEKFAVASREKLKGFSEEVEGVKFSNDGERFVIWSQGRVHVYETSTCLVVARMDAESRLNPSRRVTCCVFANEVEGKLYIGFESGLVRALWPGNEQHGDVLEDVFQESSRMKAMTTIGENLVVTATSDGTVKVYEEPWAERAGSPIGIYKTGGSRITCVAGCLEKGT